MGIPKKKERKERIEIFETIITENFPKLMLMYQTTYPGSSENRKQDKC